MVHKIYASWPPGAPAHHCSICQLAQPLLKEKITMTPLSRILAATLVAAVLSACGGGGSDPSTPSNTNNSLGATPSDGTTPSTGASTPTTPSDTTPSTGTTSSTGTTTPTTPDQTTPTTGNASGQPWGSVAISGSAVPQSGFGSLAPNGLPTMKSQGGRAGLQNVEWTYDDDYAARTTVHAANRKSFSLSASMPATAGRYVGVVNISANQFNSEGSGTSSSIATLVCGGGAFAFDPRDAACDKITFDLAARTLTLDNVSFIADQGSTTRSATFQVSGTLKWPDVRAKTGTTVTKAQLMNCPLVATPGIEFNPAWGTASCANGTYVGTSETGQACTVTVDSTNSKASFNADGYVPNYSNVLQRSSFSASAAGTTVSIWGFHFSSNNTLFGDHMTHRIAGGVSGATIATYSPSSTTPLAVRFTALSSNVTFNAGNAVINSPLRTKFCELALD